MQADIFLKGRGGALLKIGLVCFFEFFSPHTVKTKLPFSFTKTANYWRLAANLLSTPTTQTPSSHQRTQTTGSPRASPLGSWVLGLPEKSQYHPRCRTACLTLYNPPRHTRPPLCICFPSLSRTDGCVLVHPEEAGVPAAKEATSAKARPPIQP